MIIINADEMPLGFDLSQQLREIEIRLALGGQKQLHDHSESSSHPIDLVAGSLRDMPLYSARRGNK
jgi:hypothetical protein